MYLAGNGKENMRDIESINNNNLSSRERLLEASRELFYEQGYAATTLAQISRKSGVNNGLITYYFGTKSNLASEIYNLFLKSVRDEISLQLFSRRKEFNMELGMAVEQRILLAQKFENPKLLRFCNEYQKERDYYTVTGSRRERYYELQRELINPDLSDIDLKLYEVCGIAIVRSITDAFEKGYLGSDLEYMKDYVIHYLLTMVQLNPFRISAIVKESQYWEEELKIKVGPGFAVYSE